MNQTETFDQRLSRFFETSSRSVLAIFIVILTLSILAGSAWTLFDLRLIFSLGLHEAFKSLLIDMLTVLALVEILRTSLTYLSEGRVKVTYIIDTVLVTVLTEAMAFWQREIDWNRLSMLLALVLTLAAIRVLTVRYSPRRMREEI